LFVTFFDGFAAKNWQPTPFCSFSYEERDGSSVVTFFYGDPDVKKVVVANNFFFFGSLWFSLLELTINNIMVVFC
jgi:hypothetical protein